MNDCLITYTFNETTELGFTPPAPWYVRDALDDVVFIKTRSRQKAQEVVNEVYGVGKYRVASSKLFY